MSLTLYEHANFKGREVTLTQSTPDLRQVNDFNDIASSAKVRSGTWILYEHANYQGRFYQATRGDISMDLLKEKLGNDLISSVKLVK